VFCRQFEALVQYNNWAPREKATHLSAALQVRVWDVLHEVPKGATYETIKAPEDCFGDQNLAVVSRTQLKTSTQLVGESLQELATATEYLAHYTFPVPPEEHVLWKAGEAFIDRIIDPYIKYTYLWVERERTKKPSGRPST
jgi:hypothetical protein